MIRNACHHDLEAVTLLESCCFPREQAATFTQLKKRIQTFANSFFVYEQHLQIVGMINGCVCNQKTISDDLYEAMQKHNPKGMYQVVFGLDVHPDYQHQGIAHKLIQHMEEVAKNEKRKGMILTCLKEKIAFYEHLGFTVIGVSNSTHGNVIWYDMIKEWS